MRNNVKKPLQGYCYTPLTLGDQIKNKRLELQLFQKEAAILIGVSESGLGYWENNKNQPQIHFYPKVTEFLGYFPFSIDTSTLRGKITEYRFRKGLSHKKLGKLLEVEGSTICDWESGTTNPNGDYLKRLLELLTYFH